MKEPYCPLKITAPFTWPIPGSTHQPLPHSPSRWSIDTSRSASITSTTIRTRPGSKTDRDLDNKVKKICTAQPLNKRVYMPPKKLSQSHGANAADLMQSSITLNHTWWYRIAARLNGL